METNFKVDMPSFALGYSAGKKKGGSGGGVELNIAYGDEPPEDTSKLWVKTSEPSGLTVSPFVPRGNGVSTNDEMSITTLSDKLPSAVGMSGIGCAMVGDDIYLIGCGSITYQSYMWRFSTVDDSLSVITTDNTIGLYNMGCAAVGSKIYLFGGKESYATLKKDIYCFDTTTNAVTKLEETLSQNLMNMCCTAVGSKIYLFGGYYNESSASKNIYCFDTETEKIEQLTATVPASRADMACAAVGSKIYLFGGYSGSSYYKNIYCFDTETEKISTISQSLPLEGSQIFGATIGSKVYLFGGVKGGVSRSDICCFDTIDNGIVTIAEKLPSANSGMCGASTGSRIYLFGGTYEDDILCYGFPAVVIDEGTIHIVLNSKNNPFYIVNNDTSKVEVCVSAVYRGNAEGIGEKVETALYKDGEWQTI